MNKKQWIKATNDAANGKDTPKQALENYYRKSISENMAIFFKIANFKWIEPFLSHLIGYTNDRAASLAADDCELFKIYRMLCNPKCSRHDIHDELMLFIMFFVDNDKSEAWQKYYRSPNGLDKFDN